MSKKQVWFEVDETETIDACLERMKKQGYMPVGRKEEPLFQMVNGKPVPIRQIIKFKGILIEK
ncbi:MULTISPECIES: NETI motif-containing protein [unclassified Rummeliibacillus]|uniref:NETI motif-containing protein n=1 Tax=unclassified Rummeliibacillus TaxID=2622809 RepID=UPI000E669AD2|nr:MULTISPECIES: NETI motif-containing protein [unclassified Rummeliibacillus]RIJ68777.1 NETI motif-containing protein [Rummeliibacillus sp. POC4]RPJ94539.1 NETI motif-containing protein [Rummeliibacillus sp. TYF005]